MRTIAPAALLASLGLAGCAAATRAPAAPERPAVRPDGMEVVARAEWDWPLRTLDGEPVSLAEYRGRVIFLNLWATWCPPCVAELASIAALRASLPDERVAFLLVSPEGPAPVREFLRRHAYDLPVLLEDGRMPEAYGLRALPTTFVISPEGDVVLRHRGAADWDDDAVRALLGSLADGAAQTQEHAGR